MHNSISDMVLDCLQNSIEASSTDIILDFKQIGTNLTVVISDDGKGMDEVELAKAKDPFYTDGIKHSKRKVGLGIPFLIQTVEMTNGSYSLTSVKGEGTTLSFILDLSNIDLPPIGKCIDTFFSALLFDGNFELTINRTLKNRNGESSYTIIRSELLDVLGDFDTVETLNLLKDFLLSQESEIEELKNGKNDFS